jgi:hypothetical protein
MPFVMPNVRFRGKADMTSYSTFGKSGQRAPHGPFMLYIKKEPQTTRQLLGLPHRVLNRRIKLYLLCTNLGV